MSDLSPIEKIKLEKLFGMETGYVLDFSNYSFKEFILESINIDIYDENYSFRSGSKANRLRAFWKKESNKTVGELLEKLLEYWEIQNPTLTFEDQKLLDGCKKIASRLRGDSEVSESNNPNDDESFLGNQAQLLSKFDEFADLANLEDKQKRGILLEDLLERIFTLYGIPTQKSFRRNEGGEQIDGAFKLEGWYYLVECKWTQKLTDIRQLDSLYGKINRSGRQTLGLFLSINGWSQYVVPLLKQNHDKSIILMDGYDLRCVLVEHNHLSLQDLLMKKLECLNFEGEPFCSAAKILY